MSDCDRDLRELRLLNERKDHFITALAHELRNPLAPIANAVDVLTTSGDDPQVVPYACDIIRRQMRLLQRLVDDLLDVSRIAQGTVDLTRTQLDVRTVLGTAVEAVLPLTQSRDQRLSVSMPPRPLVLEADPTRLTQVFTNLLHNAAKYTPAGGRIAVSAEGSEGRVTVRVRDDGIGIAPEALPGIFELFARVESKGGSDRGGLGIGLSLARQLVELHGGSISAHSEGLGRGSEFVVRLPGA